MNRTIGIIEEIIDDDVEYNSSYFFGKNIDISILKDTNLLNCHNKSVIDNNSENTIITLTNIDLKKYKNFSAENCLYCLESEESNSVSEKTKAYAYKLLFSLRKVVEFHELGWKTPLISIVAEDSEIVFEWWHKEKKITLYILEELVEYIKVWGLDIENEMEDGILNINSHKDIKSLWEWMEI